MLNLNFMSVGIRKKVYAIVCFYFSDDKFRLAFMENSGNSDKLNNCRLTCENISIR